MACIVLVLLLVSSAGTQGGPHPTSISLESTAPLPLLAQARRLHLFGAVEYYTLAVYGNGERLDPARLASVDAAKALRIQVTYEEDLQRPLSLDWRRELVPHLSSSATAHLQGSFAPLQHGDVVVIEYVPAKGTTVRVNKAVVVSGAHHDLMLAFLEHWLGQRPLSEDIKEMLLGS
jgi:hypothetical protein